MKLALTFLCLLLLLPMLGVAQWEKLPDPPTGTVRLYGAGKILMASYNLTCTRSTDEGLTWVPYDSSHPHGLNYTTFCHDGPTIYVASNGPNEGQNRVFKSVDSGATWGDITGNIGQMPTLDLACTGNLILAGLYLFGSYRSLYGGGSWESVEMQPGAREPSLVRNCKSVTVRHRVALAIYEPGGLRRSTTNGTGWAVDTAGLGNSGSPHWVKFAGALAFANTDSGLFRSADSGLTWSPVLYLSQRLTGGAFVVSGSTVTGRFPSGSILVSYDGGINWDDVSSGLHGQLGSLFAITDSFLFVSTNSGLWRKTLTGIVSGARPLDEHRFPERISLRQNYPNPFNPSTRIEYALAEEQHVTLTVYNVIGERVAVLEDRREPPGAHSIIFDAGALPGGVYICRLKAGEFTQVRKMLFLK